MGVLMLAIFVVMVAIATQYPPQARFMPLVIGIPGIALCLHQLIAEIRGRGKPPAGIPEPAVDGPGVAGENRREIVIWAYFIGLVASLILFGFWPTIPIFILLFLRFAAGEGWRFSFGLAFSGAAILFLVFHQGLGVVLHNGFITGYLLNQLFPAQ